MKRFLRPAVLTTAAIAATLVIAVLIWPRHDSGRSGTPATHTAPATPRQTFSPTPAVSSAPTTAQPSSPSAASTPINDPTAVATAYVTAAESLDWHWTSAAGYLPTIRPLSTPDHWTRDLQPLADAPSGATFQDAQAAHVTWTVNVTNSSIVTAAPHSASDCWVRVTYNVQLWDENGRPGGVPNSGSLNLGMRLIDGDWLVEATTNEGG